MHILTIETTGELGSVAIVDKNSNITERVCYDKMSHLKSLMPMIEDLMKTTGLHPKDLDCLCASIGPGSFTGIRIGISTARALSQALDIPCIEAPTLDIFRIRAKENQGRATCVIFNARRNQVYGAIYNHKGEDILTPGPYMIQDIINTINNQGLDNVIFYGDGIDAYSHLIEEDIRVNYEYAHEDERYQRASLATLYAINKFKKNEKVSYHQLLPNYMRETEAETKLKSGKLEKERIAKMERIK